jgi:hypothetical protein
MAYELSLSPHLQVKVIHNKIWKHFCHISEIRTNLNAYIQTTGSACIIWRKEKSYFINAWKEKYKNFAFPLVDIEGVILS